MTNYPKYLFEGYANQCIDKSDFLKQLSEWQKAHGLDYTCKKTINNSDVYFTYRNITATIKRNKLHFKTYKNDTAKTPFEFRRKVDFYLEKKDREIRKALSTISFYFEKAIKAINNLEINDYQTNIEKAEDWLRIAKERMIWL